jgi:hypothetical protein
MVPMPAQHLVVRQEFVSTIFSTRCPPSPSEGGSFRRCVLLLVVVVVVLLLLLLLLLLSLPL